MSNDHQGYADGSETQQARLLGEAKRAERELEAADAGASPTVYRRARRSVRQPSQPSQVYSVRIPVAQIEQLRAAADHRGVAPTALLREWLIERLRHEDSGPSAHEQYIEEGPSKPRGVNLGATRRMIAPGSVASWR